MGIAPQLPDGLVVIVKRDCQTCRTIVPAVAQMVAEATLDITVYTQDDPAFPAEVPAIYDADLAVSWHHDIETVPTLLRVADGVEEDRAEGWVRDEWIDISGIDGLGDDLPPFRPGCGSLSVDPNRVDELRVLHGGSRLRSRRIEIASAQDPIEMMFQRGWSDGLPVVPPTEERVLAMLEGTGRAADDIVAVIPPDLIEASVEKVAITAVMAGCLPEYLPWVIAAVEAACTDEFNMHGLLATTMPVGPVLICSGPGTVRIGMNSGINALGQGNRANSTIGRALQLLVRNVGGGRPGEVDRAALGSPAKVGFCFAESPDSPWGSLAEQRGMDPGIDALTVFAGEAPRGLVDQLSRTPESLAASLAHQLQAVHHHKLVLGFDAILVISPEHERVFTQGGWNHERIHTELMKRLQTPVADLERGAHGIAEGVPPGFGGSLPKFAQNGLMLAHAGGRAGLFSSIIPGWVNGATGSAPVTTQVMG